MNIDAALTIVCILFIVLWFFGPYQELITSVARQGVFRRRDEIFDMAAAGKLDFTSLEYRTIRSSLEHLIRFAHELTLARFLFIRLFAPHQNGSYLNKAIKRIEDPETRQRVRDLVDESQSVLFWMMIAKSPATFYIYGIFLLLKKVTNRRPDWAAELEGKYYEKIQAEAEASPLNNSDVRLAA